MAFLSKKVKKMAFRPVRAGINQIDFVTLVEYLSKLEPGRSFISREGRTEPAFMDQEEVIQRTMELTARDMEAKGGSYSPKDIEDYARSISCRYDPEIHKNLGFRGIQLLILPGSLHQDGGQNIYFGKTNAS